MASSSTTTEGRPNCDTVYSIAWCGLNSEPLVLSVPSVTDRYSCIELVEFDSDTFGFVGTRATGTGAGHYLLAAPNWKGKIKHNPDNTYDRENLIQDVLPRPCYPSIFLLGRTGITSGTADDVAAAVEIQEGYKLTPCPNF